MSSVVQDILLPSQHGADHLSHVPVLVLRQHLLPYLDREDWDNLRLVNRQFSDIHRCTTSSLHVRICQEALRTLQPTTTASPHTTATVGPSIANPFGLQRRYPSVRHVSLCCDARPLTPLLRGQAVAELLRQLAGQCSSQVQLTLLDAHRHQALGGNPITLPGRGSIRHHRPAYSIHTDHGPHQTGRGHNTRGRSDCDSDGDGVENQNDITSEGTAAVARMLATVFPDLRGIRFAITGALRPEARASDTIGPTIAAAAIHKHPSASEATSALLGGRALLAPQLLLLHLSAALLQFTPCDCGGSGGSGETSVRAGLQALCIDYSQISADPFEAELLDSHFPRLPLLLLDIRVGPVAAAAALHADVLRPSHVQRPTGGDIMALPPLLRLTSLELRGVTVQPGLLEGLRELALLTRLVLSVSCVRPYEPLVTNLPYLKRLAHLHLFLHVPMAAAARQLNAAASAATEAMAAMTVAAGASGGERGYRGLEDVDTPDCTAIQLAAAVSQCRTLVSLGLPGEDVGGQMPAILQALPGLTHLEARQLGPWDLPQPNTRLRSLILTMTWPSYLSQLLPSLPQLHDVRADIYVYAEGDGDGGGGGGGVEQLYNDMLAVASGLCRVRCVELQLSVMRCEPWEWPQLVRLLRRVRNLRGLTLRMPQRDSGPQLRGQHFADLCGQLTELRRLTLLLAHRCSFKLNFKALQALRNLPYIEQIQLHLGGVWNGRRVPDRDGDEDRGFGRWSSGAAAANGGGGSSSGRGRLRNCCFRQGRPDAAAKQRDNEAANCRRRTSRRSGKGEKYGAEKSSGVQSTARQRSTAHDEEKEERTEGAERTQGPSGAGGGYGCGSTAVCAPPLPPDGSAAWEVLAVARGLLGGRRHRQLRQRQPQRGLGRSGVAGDADRVDNRTFGPGSESTDDADGDVSSGTKDATESDARLDDGEADAASGNDSGGVGPPIGEHARAGGLGLGTLSAGKRGGGGGSGACGGDDGDGCELIAQRPQPVEFQVDFLTGCEAAQVNAVLRWEGVPVRVRSGLQPRWVWADLAGLGGCG